MQNNILKTALIGVGNMGRKYAEMITAGEVPHMKLTGCRQQKHGRGGYQER